VDHTRVTFRPLFHPKLVLDLTVWQDGMSLSLTHCCLCCHYVRWRSAGSECVQRCAAKRWNGRCRLTATACRPVRARLQQPCASRSVLIVTHAVAWWPRVSLISLIGRVSYIRIYLCYFCFRWKTVSLVQASMQHLMHHVTVSLQQSKITLQNNCINNSSITQPTLYFYLWLKM